MPYVKFTGNYGAFITGRDVDSAVHYEDASDQTCIGFVPAVREGDEEIEQAEYESLKATILAYNAAIPVPAEPTPDPDPQAVLLTNLAAEWESAATELRASRPAAAADALERAAQVARGAAQ